MKVKKFIAPTMPEVMMKVRKDLGVDAVILNSKVVHHGGFLGFFKKKNIEVIAALDPQPHMPRQQKSKVESRTEPNKPTVDYTESKEEIIKEVKELRKWIENNTGRSEIKFPNNYQKLYDLLLNHEVNKTLATELVHATLPKNGHKDSDSVTFEVVKQDFYYELKKRMDLYSYKGIDYKKKFIHLVGPTGVGKTTTIAKLAAKCVLQDNKKVAFITTDTFRIAAIDQLKTYSKILNVPLEIAYTIEDYKNAREKFKDYDLVFVDTAGRNFKNPTYVKELGKIVDFNKDLETFLVLSMTTRKRDMEDLMDQFKNIPINQLILTKKDETSTYGTVLNLTMLHHVGIAYITDGQNVPDDINEVSINLISQMIVGEQ